MTLDSVSTKFMQFFKEKNDHLQKRDLSRKGSIDSRITELVNFINSQNSFITTSSCSGRTIVFTNSDTKKRGCKWIFVSHDIVYPDDIIKALQSHSGSAVLKFEPFILHTQCLTIGDAQKLHHFGIEAGFKNSGISIGKHGKIIVAIRSTLSLEVPLSSESNLLVSKEYISFVVGICNEKMLCNWQRIERFHTRLQTINNHSEENSTSKKIHRSLPDRSDHQDSNVATLNEKSLSSDEKLPIDTYYEGFHTLVNDTERDD